jgi:hypothetical protein
VIPPSESASKGLKLSAMGYCEMGRKDFPGSDLMIAQESKMCPPQVSHPQHLENVPQIISLWESDEKLGNRCALPSSQLGQNGIYGSHFSLITFSKHCLFFEDTCKQVTQLNTVHYASFFFFVYEIMLCFNIEILMCY